VLGIYINDVEFPIANHSFSGMQTEYSITMGSHQLLVGVHAIHSDVSIPDCPHQFYKASALLPRAMRLLTPIFFRISQH
jgi:hypothetical protein